MPCPRNGTHPCSAQPIRRISLARRSSCQERFVAASSCSLFTNDVFPVLARGLPVDDMPYYRPSEPAQPNIESCSSLGLVPPKKPAPKARVAMRKPSSPRPDPLPHTKSTLRITEAGPNAGERSSFIVRPVKIPFGATGPNAALTVHFNAARLPRNCINSITVSNPRTRSPETCGKNQMWRWQRADCDLRYDLRKGSHVQWEVRESAEASHSVGTCILVPDNLLVVPVRRGGTLASFRPVGDFSGVEVVVDSLCKGHGYRLMYMFLSLNYSDVLRESRAPPAGR